MKIVKNVNKIVIIPRYSWTYLHICVYTLFNSVSVLTYTNHGNLDSIGGYR